MRCPDFRDEIVCVGNKSKCPDSVLINEVSCMINKVS